MTVLRAVGRGALALGCVVAIGLLALLAAGCQQWHERAEVRLKDGTVIVCPSGLRLETDQIVCMGSGISVRWKNVAGFATR